MQRAKTRLEHFDYSGAEHLLSAYGGMGSFNDLIRGQMQINGQFAWRPDYVELNDRLDTLRSRAWYLAQWINKAQK